MSSSREMQDAMAARLLSDTFPIVTRLKQNGFSQSFYGPQILDLNVGDDAVCTITWKLEIPMLYANTFISTYSDNKVTSMFVNSDNYWIYPTYNEIQYVSVEPYRTNRGWVRNNFDNRFQNTYLPVFNIDIDMSVARQVPLCERVQGKSTLPPNIQQSTPPQRTIVFRPPPDTPTLRETSEQQRNKRMRTNEMEPDPKRRNTSAFSSTTTTGYSGDAVPSTSGTSSGGGGSGSGGPVRFLSYTGDLNDPRLGAKLMEYLNAQTQAVVIPRNTVPFKMGRILNVPTLEAPSDLWTDRDTILMQPDKETIYLNETFTLYPMEGTLPYQKIRQGTREKSVASNTAQRMAVIYAGYIRKDVGI